MKAGIVVFPGTNCDRDTKGACEYFGWEAEYIWHDETSLERYDVVFLPGGFSYGDYIRAGRLAKFSPVLKALKNYVAQKRGFVVGICNGFQILCEAGILPGALSVNTNTRFICDISELETNRELPVTEIKLPIAHGEGRYLPAANDLTYKDMIFLRYKRNPNGSTDEIAGLYDKNNKVIGMMPHPERAVFKETGYSDGRYIFKMIENKINEN